MNGESFNTEYPRRSISFSQLADHWLVLQAGACCAIASSVSLFPPLEHFGVRVASSSPEVHVIQGSTGPAAVALWRKGESRARVVTTFQRFVVGAGFAVLPRRFDVSGEVVCPRHRWLPMPGSRVVCNAGLSPKRETIVHCQAGVRTTTGVFALALLGWRQVRAYDAAMADWANRDDTPLVVEEALPQRISTCGSPTCAARTELAFFHGTAPQPV